MKLIKILNLILIFLFSLFCLVNLAFAQSNVDIVSPGANGVVFPDDQDFASLSFSDPWDMSNLEDAIYTRNFTHVRIGHGRWDGITTNSAGHFWVLFGGYPGSYPNGHEGAVNRINANYYKRFAVKMYSHNSGTARLWWFWNQDMKEKGRATFTVNAGWNIYYVDFPGAWHGSVTGLRLDPVNVANTRVVIDWIRLLPLNGRTTNIAWNYNSSLPSFFNIYLDNDQSGYNGSLIGSNFYPDQENVFQLDSAFIYPGIHYAYIVSNAGYSLYSGFIKKNQAPVFQILDPDKSGGRDWAKTYLRNPWDFNRFSDVASFRNIGGKSDRRGIFSGINTNNDPVMIMNTRGKIINTNKYRFLTFRYKYSGNFDLRRGTMSRFIWQSVCRDWSTSNDIVTYDGGWRTYTIDLKKIKLNGGRRGWRGRVKTFRFDPNEDPKRRRFYIDYIKLAAEDRLTTHFDIKYRNYDPDNSSDTLRLYWDLDRIFGNGNEHFITQKQIGNGKSAYRWRPSRSFKRRVWIYARISDGINTNGYYSTGSLRVHL